MGIYYPTTSDFVQKTLGAELLTANTTVATFNNATYIQNLAGVFIVDRVDANGVATPTKAEVISFEAVSGSTVTTLVRGLGSTSAQDHAVGAIVEFGPTATWAQGLIDTYLIGHSTTGGHKASVFTAPVVTTYTPAGAATATLDLALGNDFRITMPAGNITIALTGETVGQKFILGITQDGGGSRTVTWFTTIRWVDGSAPTLTTTASKRDVFGFIVTGSGTYDGFIVGQNI